MTNLMDLLLSFTEKKYSTSYKIAALIPGTIVFLIISPLFLYFFSHYLNQFIPLHWPRTLEISVAIIATSIAIIIMTWGTLSLWIQGKGTPAPIAPTSAIVTTGVYKFCRNPIELGTDLYFLALGTWFDTLNTGILCMIFGMALGYGYIKFVEERELTIRFGKEYDIYRSITPLFFPISFISGGKQR